MKIGQEAVIRTSLRQEMLALGIALGLNSGLLVLGYFLVLGGVAVSVWLTPAAQARFS